MKLVVGLGNPGKTYENTRHNVGYIAVDTFCKENNLKFKVESSFEGFVTSFNHAGEKLILFKPITYMNLSGRAIRKVMKYYGIEIENVLIIHDDLDLETGKFRLREKGSSGGHNGIKSIIEYFGTTEFKRLKIGISKIEKSDIVDYVLGNFSKEELENIHFAVYKIDSLIKMFMEEKEFKNIMNKFN